MSVHGRHCLARDGCYLASRTRKFLPAVRLLYYRTREHLKTASCTRSDEVKRFTRGLHRACSVAVFGQGCCRPRVPDEECRASSSPFHRALVRQASGTTIVKFHARSLCF